MAKIDLGTTSRDSRSRKTGRPSRAASIQKELFRAVRPGDKRTSSERSSSRKYQGGADLTGPRVYAGSSERSTWAILAGPTSTTTSSNPRLPSTGARPDREAI